MALFLPIQPRQAPAQDLLPVSSALSTDYSYKRGWVVLVEEESGEVPEGLSPLCNTYHQQGLSGTRRGI